MLAYYASTKATVHQLSILDSTPNLWAPIIVIHWNLNSVSQYHFMKKNQRFQKWLLWSFDLFYEHELGRLLLIYDDNWNMWEDKVSFCHTRTVFFLVLYHWGLWLSCVHACETRPRPKQSCTGVSSFGCTGSENGKCTLRGHQVGGDKVTLYPVCCYNIWL